jgi:predicted Zn-ribbon and HTH transcriptional regulator
MPVPPIAPRRANETVREALRRELLAAASPLTALELSGLVGVAHRQVDEHLEHLRRTQQHRDEALVVEPARCLACGFEFRARDRLARPSRCPECRSERIDPPRFRIVAAHSR